MKIFILDLVLHNYFNEIRYGTITSYLNILLFCFFTGKNSQKNNLILTKYECKNYNSMLFKIMLFLPLAFTEISTKIDKKLSPFFSTFETAIFSNRTNKLGYSLINY